MVIFLYYFLLFIIYSFLGWCIESLYCMIRQRKVVSRGFLIGPYCPIYGWAALIMILLLQRYLNDPIVLFVMGAVIASIIEYITSLFMEKIFHARWWDYSHIKFNVNGRICLTNSVLFGLLCIVLLYIVNPYIIRMLNYIPPLYLIFISGFLLAIFAITYGFNGFLFAFIFLLITKLVYLICFCFLFSKCVKIARKMIGKYLYKTDPSLLLVHLLKGVSVFILFVMIYDVLLWWIGKPVITWFQFLLQ